MITFVTVCAAIIFGAQIYFRRFGLALLQALAGFYLKRRFRPTEIVLIGVIAGWMCVFMASFWGNLGWPVFAYFYYLGVPGCVITCAVLAFTERRTPKTPPMDDLIAYLQRAERWLEKTPRLSKQLSYVRGLREMVEQLRKTWFGE